MAHQTDWVQVMPPVPGMAEAEMWRGLLADHDIVALVRQNDASLYLGPQSFCHVLVSVRDAQRATELIEAWRGEDIGDTAPPPDE